MLTMYVKKVVLNWNILKAVIWYKFESQVRGLDITVRGYSTKDEKCVTSYLRIKNPSRIGLGEFLS